ncbi:MAG: EAL domain-containing protein [Alteripontixanthobacter sp.]
MPTVDEIKQRLRELSLIDLSYHHVEEHDREWFAWCKIKQTQHFPFLAYDVVKLVTALLVYQSFVSPLALAAIAITASCVIIAQFRLDQRMEAGTHAHSQNYGALRDIIMSRAAVWSTVYFYVLIMAPDPMLVFLVAGAMLVLFIDGLCMVAMPKRSVLAIGMHSVAIIVPMIMRGGMANQFAAVMVGGAFVFLHYTLFTLHHMFATRRLRTRSLEVANDTIQLLLNQYDEDGSDWLLECDATAKIMRPNRRFCDASGKTVEQLEGLQMYQLFKDGPERDELRAIGERKESFRDLTIPLEINGEEHWWSISGRPVYDRDGQLTCWRGFIADVTRTRLAEKKVTFMAHYDVLTNLPNRSLFNTTLNRAFSRRDEDELLAVLFIDLDHFKNINDTFGHAVGDRVLAEAGRRLEEAVPNNAMVARLGGDEFGVLLDQIGDRGEAKAIAESIVTAMDKPVALREGQMQIGASVGVAFAPDNGANGEELLSAADLALYDAKARGRHGASLFDPAMQQEVLERRALELDLREALARRELVLLYQPLLDAQSTQIVGYEALLRWEHPERGLVSPEIFVPIAEDLGQIVAIGEWVLREALHEASGWPEHLFVSVNLSPAQMRDPQLLNTVVNALAAGGIAPHRLELEITETLLMQESEENIALLHRFRDLGVRIALDDFGTGYSSLNYLRSFPFDKIKIDRCFVSDITKTSDSDAIIEAVVSLAGKLNMVTTAEGVERIEQLEKLRGTGCTQVQGYLFSKAIPPAEMAHNIGTQAVAASGVISQLPEKSPHSAVPPKRKAG